MSNNLIKVAKIVGVHGVKGFVALKIFSDDPASVLEQGAVTDQTSQKTFKFTLKFPKKGVFIFAIDGVNDRNAAEALKGTELYISEDNLGETEEDEFYHKDLIGCEVFDQNGTSIGSVTNIENYGAKDLLEINRQGRVALLPFQKETIQDVDLKAKKIQATIPDGLFDL